MLCSAAGTFVVAGGFLVLGTVVHVLQLLFCKAPSAEEEDELPVRGPLAGVAGASHAAA